MLPEQVVALLEDQVRNASSPGLTVVGTAEKVTVGSESGSGELGTAPFSILMGSLEAVAVSEVVAVSVVDVTSDEDVVAAGCDFTVGIDDEIV